ncbi:hypothetical protein B0H14DRAFT_2627145 [Mycena olivaceomarginata]|nr:hypothetical protein B0H14DRAFT_2627145 [Mycena olivaceomarginata]
MTIVEAAAYTSTCLPLDGGAPGLDEAEINDEEPIHWELTTSQHTIESDDTLLRPRRWRDSSISESWFLELCLAASSRLVMDVTSQLDAARHGLQLGLARRLETSPSTSGWSTVNGPGHSRRESQLGSTFLKLLSQLTPTVNLQNPQIQCQLVFSLLVFLGLSLREFLAFLFESTIPEAGMFMGYRKSNRFAPEQIFRAWHGR